MFCTRCGMSLDQRMSFCPRCGTPTMQAAPQQPTVPPWSQPKVTPTASSRGKRVPYVLAGLALVAVVAAGTLLVPRLIGGMGNATVTSQQERLSAGLWHTCGVTGEGAVRCWGTNNFGQLGDGTTTNSPHRAVGVLGLSSGVKQVAAGAASTCALMSDGSIKCWGKNDNGQLGSGSSTISSPVPVDVRGLAGKAVSVAVGGTQACAALESGAVQCWGGSGYFGELGIDRATRSLKPVDVPNITGARSVSSMYYSTCALTKTGSTTCWGYTEGEAPVVPTVVATGSTSASTWCAVIDGGLQCWGHATSAGVSARQPTLSSGKAIAVSTGASGACALTASGGVVCWGDNTHGILGDGTTTSSPQPVPVSSLSGKGVAVAVGWFHACAMTDKEVLCWGATAFGPNDDQVEPTAFSSKPVSVTNWIS